MSYDESWEAVRDRIRRQLRALLTQSDLPDELAERMVAAGRFNRGALCCLIADRACEEETASVAAAIELIHRASVIRDDIQDGDDVRRGAPTEAALMGMPTALALADVLLSIGFQTLAKLTPDAIGRVLETFVRMARGQFHDIYGGPASRAHGPFYLAELKTGSLLGLAFWTGARAARRSERDCLILDEIGTHLGVAFQLANDVNNVARDEGRGKTIGSDLTERRHSSVRLLMAGVESGALRSPELSSAVRQVSEEMNRELERARALVPQLETPLPRPVYALIFDAEAAEAFVADQQASHGAD